MHKEIMPVARCEPVFIRRAVVIIGFPNKKIHEQAAQAQPRLLSLLLVWFVPAHAPRLLTLLLSQLTFFVEWAGSHHSAYLTAFFLFQMMLMVWATSYAFRKYGKALYSTNAKFWSRRHLCLFVALPLIILHARDVSAFVDSFRQMVDLAGPSQLEGAIHQLHERVWKSMAYGSSWLGVIYFSISTLSVPLWEEAIFSGFVCNRIGTSRGWLAGLIVTPLIFTLIHLPVMTEPSALIMLYAAGLTYTSIRLLGGSVFFAVTAHTLINIYVMLPKWLLAWLHFRYLGMEN